MLHRFWKECCNTDKYDLAPKDLTPFKVLYTAYTLFFTKVKSSNSLLARFLPEYQEAMLGSKQFSQQLQHYCKATRSANARCFKGLVLKSDSEIESMQTRCKEIATGLEKVEQVRGAKYRMVYSIRQPSCNSGWINTDHIRFVEEKDLLVLVPRAGSCENKVEFQTSWRKKTHEKDTDFHASLRETRIRCRKWWEEEAKPYREKRKQLMREFGEKWRPDDTLLLKDYGEQIERLDLVLNYMFLQLNRGFINSAFEKLFEVEEYINHGKEFLQRFVAELAKKSLEKQIADVAPASPVKRTIRRRILIPPQSEASTVELSLTNTGAQEKRPHNKQEKASNTASEVTNHQDQHQSSNTADKNQDCDVVELRKGEQNSCVQTSAQKASNISCLSVQPSLHATRINSVDTDEFEACWERLRKSCEITFCSQPLKSAIRCKTSKQGSVKTVRLKTEPEIRVIPLHQQKQHEPRKVREAKVGLEAASSMPSELQSKETSKSTTVPDQAPPKPTSLDDRSLLEQLQMNLLRKSAEDQSALIYELQAMLGQVTTAKSDVTTTTSCDTVTRNSLLPIENVQ